jgi:hypothetical protein
VRCCLRRSAVANRLMDLVGYSGDLSQGMLSYR